MPIRLTLTRVVWATLPVTLGPAALAVASERSGATGAVIAIWLLAVWIIGFAALVVPRPFGLTVLRATAPIAPLVAIWAIATDTGTAGARAVAGAVAVVTVVLATSAAVATWCVEGTAYGDERRFPLRTPPALTVTLVPLAVALIAAGTLAGPLLIAAGRWVLGGIAVALGAGLAFGAFRSLHLLARRFVVVVPAGIVIADPMTLTDPFLFVREHVVDLAPIADGSRPDGALDLRLGAAMGAVALHLDGAAPLTLRRRTVAVPAAATAVLVTPIRRRALLEAAGERRIRIAS